MRVVFFGTPEPAADALRALLASDHDVVAVVTQPDRVRGRGRSTTPSPVKALAAAHGVPVLQPESPRQEGFAEALRPHAPGALAVVAYGHILPRAVLEVAPAMNVHFSLLPSYRGAAPVQRALMDGATETGVSVFLLEPTVDTGPVLFRERVAIAPEETAGDLLARMAPVGAAILVRALDGLAAGSLDPQPQDDTAATPAPKIRPEETEIDWRAPAARVVGVVRALSPRPGAHSTFRGRRLIVERARIADAALAPGEIAGGAALVVGCGDGAVELLAVRPEGKRSMSGADLVRGYRPEAGERLGGSTAPLG